MLKQVEDFFPTFISKSRITNDSYPACTCHNQKTIPKKSQIFNYKNPGIQQKKNEKHVEVGAQCAPFFFSSSISLCFHKFPPHRSILEFLQSMKSSNFLFLYQIEYWTTDDSLHSIKGTIKNKSNILQYVCFNSAEFLLVDGQIFTVNSKMI